MKPTPEEERNIVLLLKKMNKEGNMSFQEIVNSGFLTDNRNTVHDRLDEIVREGLIKELNRSTLKHGQKLWHIVTVKGRRWLNKRQIERLETDIQDIREVVTSMLEPERLWRFMQEGAVPFPERFPVNTDPDAPARIDFMTAEEWKEFFDHKEKVFGNLRRCFFDLAKVVVQVEGMIAIWDDLENAEVHFRNGRALWIALPE